MRDAQPVRDVVAHGHVWEERVVLKDHGRAAAVHRQVVDTATADLDVAEVGVVEAGDHP